MDSSSSLLLENTCRVCLISNPYSIYHDINKHSPKLGKIIAVAIMECATVKVKLNDDFPDQICEKCLNQLVYAQEFKKVCIASDLKQTRSSVSSDCKNKSQSSLVVSYAVEIRSSNDGVISDKRRLTADMRIRDIDSHKQIGCNTNSQKDYSRQSDITNENKHYQPSNIEQRNVITPPKFPKFSSLDQKKQFVPFHIQERNNSRQSNIAMLESSNSGSANPVVPLDSLIVSTMDHRKQVVRNSVPLNSQEKNRASLSIAKLQCEQHNEDDDDLVPPDPPKISKAEQQNEVRNYYRNYAPLTTPENVLLKSPETNFPSTNTPLPIEPYNLIKDNCRCLKCGKIFDDPNKVRIHMGTCELSCICGKTFKTVSLLFYHKRVKGCPASKKMEKNNQDMGIDSPGVSQQTKGKKKNKKNKKGNKHASGQEHRCYGCSLFFDKLGSLLEHRPFCENLSWRTQARSFHKCFECDEKFITKDQLLKHKSTTCKGTNWMEGDKFKCHFCFGLFDSMIDVKAHRRNKTCVNVNLTCLNCDTTFKAIEEVKNHRMRRECLNPHRKNKK